MEELKQLIESLIDEVFWEASKRPRRHINKSGEIPTFSQWLMHAGGEEYLDTHYQGYADLDDPEEREEALKEFQKELEDRFDDWREKYVEFPNPVVLYRCVAVSSLDEIRTEGIGIFWTDYQTHGSCFLRKDPSVARVVIAAKVPLNAIDWLTTLDANMSTFENELEVTLKAGAKVQLIYYLDESGQKHSPKSKFGTA